MGSFSNFWENEILDHLFGKGAYTPPTIYVGLSTADPTEDGSGLAEPVPEDYARIGTAAADWNSASAGSISNAEIITFAQAEADWGTVTHFALFDADVAGNMLAYGELVGPKAIDDKDVARFLADDLVTTLD